MRRFKYDSHNFGELLQMVVLHPFSIASVTRTANCLLNSRIMLEVFKKTELLRTLNGILHVFLSNYELALKEYGGKETLSAFIHNLMFQMKEWAVTANITQTLCSSFCQEVFGIYPVNAHNIMNDSLTMLYHNSTCWLDCEGTRSEWIVYLTTVLVESFLIYGIVQCGVSTRRRASYLHVGLPKLLLLLRTIMFTSPLLHFSKAINITFINVDALLSVLTVLSMYYYSFQFLELAYWVYIHFSILHRSVMQYGGMATLTLILLYPFIYLGFVAAHIVGTIATVVVVCVLSTVLLLT